MGRHFRRPGRKFNTSQAHEFSTASALGVQAERLAARQIDLRSEMDRAWIDLLEFPGLNRWLVDRGVPHDVFVTPEPMAVCCPLGLLQATIDDDLFEPAEDGGVDLIVLPVIEDEAVVDVVGWQPSKPNRWYLRRGVADILSVEAVERGRLAFEHLDLHQSPMAWLKAGRQGAVVLRWSGHPIGQVGAITEIRFNDLAFARRVESAYQKPAFMPKIMVQRDDG